MISTIELVLAGLAVGILVGLTGVGGGSIMTPLLVQVLGVNPLVAVGTDLLYSMPTQLFGAYHHRKQETVNPQIVKTLLVGGLPAAVVGLLLLLWLRHHFDAKLIELWTKRAIGAALFLAAAMIVIAPIMKKRATGTVTSAALEWTPALRAKIVALGAMVGFLVTLTSIGSGAVTLPLLSLTLPFIELRALIGSGIAFAALVMPVAAVGRWTMGDVNPLLAITLLAGSLPGVFIGSKLCGRLSQTWLRPAVAITLAFAGTRLI
ncbi:MAG TPA: sulfite exporter TauE/SafE family protein [Candidatus Baltobacteraceae bacterium]|nr:sulfite exporter TauE/SafE family protein [Candidatus Baltobacteraceae bacterium]